MRIVGRQKFPPARSSARALQSGQATVLLAVVIALLFAIFTLVFELGRILIAREVAISAGERSGEAALSYLVDYARRRSDWNVAVLHAARNQQVWSTFYDDNTGVPSWLRDQAIKYLKLNLKDRSLVTQASIDAIGKNVVEFPYKEPNWPTAAIGIKMHVTIGVPLIFFGAITVPIAVETTSIVSVDSLLNIDGDANGSFIGEGGSAEFAGGVGRILGSTNKWVEPFPGFMSSKTNLVNQWWGCPNTFTSAYNYAKGRHAGMDFGIPEGTNLFAVTDGTVWFVGFYPNQIKPVGDLSVILQTNDGYWVTYMHMKSTSVTKDQHIKAGEMIGISDGDPAFHKDNPSFTGFSSGAHLHIQVAQGRFYDYPNDLDPEALLGLGAKDDPTHIHAAKGTDGVTCF